MKNMTHLSFTKVTISTLGATLLSCTFPNGKTGEREELTLNYQGSLFLLLFSLYDCLQLNYHLICTRGVWWRRLALNATTILWCDGRQVCKSNRERKIYCKFFTEYVLRVAFKLMIILYSYRLMVLNTSSSSIMVPILYMGVKQDLIKSNGRTNFWKAAMR